MVLLESDLVEPYKDVTPFRLLDPYNKEVFSLDLMGLHGMLVVFTCNHCPYAIAVWPRLLDFFNWGKQRGVSIIAVNPNINPDYPEDSPENMKQLIKKYELPFPYLVDKDQKVALHYGAKCTPDFYFLNTDHKIIYRGRLDDNWKDESGVTTHDLKNAVERWVNFGEVVTDQKASMGCSVKWLDQ